MKALVAFFSRDGSTKKVAEYIAKALSCDLEEIADTKKRQGFLGFLFAGMDASTKRLTKIGPVLKDPGSYELIIAGSPIWAGKMSPALRTYMTDNKDRIKKIAFFCATGSGDSKETPEDIEGIIGKDLVAAIDISTKEIAEGQYAQKADQFIAEILKAQV